MLGWLCVDWWRGSACSFRGVSEKDAEALLRHGFRLEDNIKMDLGGLGMEVWIGLSWLRMEAGGGNNMVLTESSGSVKVENFLILKLNNVLTLPSSLTITQQVQYKATIAMLVGSNQQESSFWPYFLPVNENRDNFMWHCASDRQKRFSVPYFMRRYKTQQFRQL